MGCIRVDKIVEYLCEPLRKCLKDEDPYVRKTAAVCVAKLYDINGELVRASLHTTDSHPNNPFTPRLITPHTPPHAHPP